MLKIPNRFLHFIEFMPMTEVIETPVSVIKPAATFKLIITQSQNFPYLLYERMFHRGTVRTECTFKLCVPNKMAAEYICLCTGHNT